MTKPRSRTPAVPGWYEGERGGGNSGARHVLCVGIGSFDSGNPCVDVVVITGHTPPRTAAERWPVPVWRRFAAQAQQCDRPSVTVKGLDCTAAATECEQRAAQRTHV